MKKKRVILIVMSLVLFVGVYSGYKKWNYERVNAFYLSYKRGDSLYEQQKALIKNVNSDVMEDLKIELTYQEKSHLLYSMTIVKKGIAYTFYPESEGGSLSVSLRETKNNKKICSIWFEKNLRKVDVVDSKLNKDQELFYSNQTKIIYKQILKDVYENWRIQ